MVGKVSFSADDLRENVEAMLQHMKRVRPAAAKGTFIKKVFLTATMSPAVQVAIG